MSNEFVPNNAAEIAGLIMSSGRTPEQFMNMLDVLRQAQENGVVRGDISCWEHKVQFFEMARRMYVDNGEPRMKDAESGIHEGQCEAPPCQTLKNAYFQVLRPSQPEDSERIAEYLEQLSKELVAGKPREDLIGQPSEFIDPTTRLTLPIVHAVDISHHCIMEEGDQGLLLYATPPLNTGVSIRSERSQNGRRSFSTLLEGGVLTPYTDRFVQQAALMKVDPGILYDIVYANAPTLSQTA